MWPGRGARDSTSADLEGDWALAGFEDGARHLGRRGPAGLVGYAYAGDQFHTGELEGDAWTHPEHHEPELVDRLLGLAERRARELAVEREYADATLGHVLRGRQPSGSATCCAGTATRCRRTVYRMSIDLAGEVPQAAVPEGLELRPFRLVEDAALMRDIMKRGVPRPLPPERRAVRGVAARGCSDTRLRPRAVWMAWDERRRSGRRPHRFRPRRPRLGAGTGRAPRLAPPRPRARLALDAFAALAACGLTRVELGVDAEGATRPLQLYERAGMRRAPPTSCTGGASTADAAAARPADAPRRGRRRPALRRAARALPLP